MSYVSELPDKYTFMIRSLFIFITLTCGSLMAFADDIPAPVCGLTLVVDSDGLPMVDVDFVTPEVNTAGMPLSSIALLTIQRDGRVLKSLHNPTVNSRYIWVDEDVPNGHHIYTVGVYNASGLGSEAMAECFVGVAPPTIVRGLNVRETAYDGSIEAWWDIPAADVNGRPLSTDNLAYMLYRVDQWGDTILVGRNLSNPSYRGKVSTGFTGFFVTALNGAGESVHSDRYDIHIGRPSDLPYYEHAQSTHSVYFAEGTGHAANDSGIGSADGDGVYFHLEGSGKIIFPKISLPSDSVVMRLNIYRPDDIKGQLKLNFAVDGEIEATGTVDMSDIRSHKWQEVTVPVDCASHSAVMPVVEWDCPDGFIGMDAVGFMTLELYNSLDPVDINDSIYVSGRILSVSSAGNITVYSADGRMHCRGNGFIESAMEPGVYILIRAEGVGRICIR